MDISDQAAGAARDALGRVQQSVINPVVRLACRVKVSGSHAGWRSGSAHILESDDPRDRQRALGQASFPRLLCMFTSQSLNTSPLTIRVDLDS